MNGYKVAIIAIQALGALLTVGQIGKKREPLTLTVAVGTLILTGIVCALVVLA